jgi:hypothetical protein
MPEAMVMCVVSLAVAADVVRPGAAGSRGSTVTRDSGWP